MEANRNTKGRMGLAQAEDWGYQYSSSLQRILWAIWVNYLGCKNIPEWLKSWKMRKVSSFSIHFPPVPLFHLPLSFFFNFYVSLFLLIINLVLSLFSKGLRPTFCFFVSVQLFFPLFQCLFRLFADDVFQVHSSQSCDPPLYFRLHKQC